MAGVSISGLRTEEGMCSGPKRGVEASIVAASGGG